MNLGRIIAPFIALLAIVGASSASSQAAPADAPAPIVPLVNFAGSSCILGGSQGGQWVTADKMAANVKGGIKYRMYSLAGFLGVSTGTKSESLGVPCEDTYELQVSPKRTSKYEVFGMGGNWAAVPRVPRIESTNQQVYIKAVGDELKRMGLANPKVKVSQVIRIDLEGDGSPEVLVSATNYAAQYEGLAITPNAAAGDYSIVFMRKVVNGKVQTIPIEGEVYTEDKEFIAPSAHSISAVLDLNNDKVMDIVTHGFYYEGDWHSVYQVKGTQVEEVLTCGCGV
ncbi:MAG: hypothetical protein QOH93_2362 [Chloroflexia bacterium]|jgi:hypothetical protein|nr:hypothetical protein [Chloroflexia bacterium]